jgi:acetyltransferase EpsM
MAKPVLILGGAGNGAVIAAAIDDANARGSDEWCVAGFLNDRADPASAICGHPVVGKTAAAADFVERGHYVINAILRIDGQRQRIKQFAELGLSEACLATFVHPAAYVAPRVELGPGVVVMPQVTISPGVVCGAGSLIMVAATIGHDSRLGRYCHVAAQACVGSRVAVADGVHVGMNATIREGLSVSACAALGAGAVATKDIPSGEVWAGNPARFLRRAG